jgi:hypothetical protein
MMREKVFRAFLRFKAISLLTTWSCAQESDHGGVRAVAGGLTDCFDLSDHAPIFRFVLHTHSPLRLKNTVDNRASAAQKTIFKTTILNI